MAEIEGVSPGEVLADASVATFITDLGLGIARAQKALDENSVDQIAEFVEPRDSLGGRSLLDLGLSPAFYHYQHADIACSLQLSLRVERDTSLGLNLSGSFEDRSSESSSSEVSETSTESGSSTRTQTRQASVEINSASAGTLNVGGQNFQLTGATPEERIRNLRDAITGNESSGVARVLFRPEMTPLNITTDAPPEKVQTGANTVAFIGGGFDRCLIRIDTNADTVYELDDAPEPKIATTESADNLAAYASAVEASVQALGYRTGLYAPDAVLYRYHYETGKHTLNDLEGMDAAEEAAAHQNLINLAQAMRALNFRIMIEGFADRQMYGGSSTTASDNLNVELGYNRANYIRDFLVANGAPVNLIRTNSRGEEAAADNGDDRGEANVDFRKVEITTPDRTAYWLIVHGASGGEPNLQESPEPDMRGSTGSGNGIIYLYKPSPLNLGDFKVTVDGTDFDLQGSSAGGHRSGSPEAYAKNLADRINGDESAGLKATNTANVVTIMRDGDRFQLTLVTTEQRQIQLSGTSGVTVTTQFSRTRSTNITRQNTGNRTVAVGASLDVRFSRQFEMNVTGNSQISARLVSIPAPPQFLETIRGFLDGGE